MNKWLAGNGYWCPACAGTGRGKAGSMLEYEGGATLQFYDRCSVCKGEKRLAATPEQVLTSKVPNTPAPAYHTLLSQCFEYGRRTP